MDLLLVLNFSKGKIVKEEEVYLHSMSLESHCAVTYIITRDEVKVRFVAYHLFVALTKTNLEF